MAAAAAAAIEAEAAEMRPDVAASAPLHQQQQQPAGNMTIQLSASHRADGQTTSAAAAGVSFTLQLNSKLH